MAKKEKSQADARVHGILYDQHGRKWSAVLEKETMHPVGPVYPLGWSAPWLPEPEFFRFSVEDPRSMVIDYDRIIARRREAREEYDRRMGEIAQQLYGDKAAEALENPSARLLHLAGPPPAAAEIPMAAQAGNKFVLGQTPLMPDWAKPFFPTAEEKTPAEVREQFPDVEEPRKRVAAAA